MVTIAISLWPDPARGESVSVPVDGVDTIAGYSVADTATLRTATGADYKGRGFFATTLTVTLEGQGEFLLPAFRAVLHGSSSAPITCTSIGTQLAPDAHPVSIELDCSPPVNFGALPSITGATVALS
jgi:hypothetical protein